MIDRHDVTITIGGKSYTLSGIESETYLKEVAAYLNEKLRDFSDDSSYWKLSADMRSVMLQLNIADDFFKERDRAQQLEIDLSGMRAQAEEELAGRGAAHDLEIEQLKSSFVEEVRQLKDRLSGAEREAERLRDANSKLVRELEEVKLQREQAVRDRELAIQEKEQAVRDRELAIQEKEKAVQDRSQSAQGESSLPHMDQSAIEDQILAIYDKLEEWQRALDSTQETLSRVSDDMRRL